MDDYEKTLSLIDQTNYEQSSMMENIPKAKRAIVQPSIDLIINGVFKHIEDLERLNAELRERHQRLKQQYYIRETRIDKYSMELATKS